MMLEGKLSKVLTVAMMFLLFGSTFSMIIQNTANASTIPLSQSVNPLTGQPYGDIMQYDWPQYGCDEGQSGFNPGPGPNVPNVLWKARSPGASGQVQVFNGKAFVIAGITLRAYNAFTGELVWQSTLKRPASGFGTSYTVKIDDN